VVYWHFTCFCRLESNGDGVGVQVSIYGDGGTATNVTDSSVLNNYDKLATIGTEAAAPTDVRSSFDWLNHRIAA